MAIRRPLTQVIDESTGSVLTEEFSAASGESFQVGAFQVLPDGSIDRAGIGISPNGPVNLGGCRCSDVLAPQLAGDVRTWGTNAVLQRLAVAMPNVAMSPTAPTRPPRRLLSTAWHRASSDTRE
jgi:hypothetical protein